MPTLQLARKFDLREKAWRHFTKGDIGVSLHWVNKEPTMILFPCHRPGSVSSYGIPLENLHQYMNSNGYPVMENMVAMAASAAQQLGMSIDKSTLFRIIDVVVEHTPDLIEMPPMPDHAVEKAAREHIGEISIKAEGRTIMEQPITAEDADEMSGVH